MRKLRLLFLLAILLVCTKTFAYDFMVDGVAYNITSTTDFTVAVTSGGTSATIPSSVVYRSKTYSVTAIGSDAFDNFYYLKSVTIPNSVTSIGNGAFQECYGLTSVNITDLAAWCKIDFSGEYYWLSNPLYYAKHLYLNGADIKEVTIPNGVKSIRAYHFRGCNSLESVSIPNSVTSIGKEAFCGCKNIKIVTSKITSLFDFDRSAFEDDVYADATLYVPADRKNLYLAHASWGRFYYIAEMPTAIQS